MADKLIQVISGQVEELDTTVYPPDPPVIVNPEPGHQMFATEILVYGTAENNTKITLKVSVNFAGGGSDYFEKETDTVNGTWSIMLSELEPGEYALEAVATSYYTSLTSDPTFSDFDVLEIPAPFAAFHVPKHEYEWGFSVNRPVEKMNFARRQYSKLLFDIKELLIGTEEVPWEVEGSCDGASHGLDGVDRWDEVNKITFAFEELGGPRSWIVLKQPAIHGGFYLLIECFSPSFPAHRGMRIVVATTPFSGGGVDSRPSSATEVELRYGGWGYRDNVVTSDLVLHYIYRLDGKGFKLLINYEGRPDDFWSIDVPLRYFGGWVKPWTAVFNFQSAQGACVFGHGWGEDSSLYANLNGTGQELTSVNEMFGEVHPSQLHEEHPHSVSGRWPLIPISVASEVPERGFHAFIADLWWGSLKPATGSTYVNDEAERVWAQFQQLVVPWDGSVPIDSDPERIDIDGEALPSYAPSVEEGAVIVYLMRAFKFTDPSDFVYWTVKHTPDKEGQFAPVPAEELRDIVVQFFYCEY